MVDASPDARALGVRRGIPLGTAYRLVPEAVFLDHDADDGRRAAEAVFEALARLTPSLAGSVDPTAAAFGVFELGIDGLGPLWGPEPVLVERVDAAIRAALPTAPPTARDAADLRPRIGIADTGFAATVAAVAARPGAPVIVTPGETPAFLADRRAGLLTTDADVRARLARFGLHRIGAVAGLPRSALVARFGDAGTRLHARARGEEIEPFRARQVPRRLALSLPIEPPTEDLGPLRFVLHRLVAALVAQLDGRGLAADRALLALDLDLAFAAHGTPPRIEAIQRFPEPGADAEAIERLLFARVERRPPPAAVAGLLVELRGTAPAAGQQLSLFVPQAARSARLDWQLARLALTFGEDRIGRVAVTDPEAPLPERRFAWRPIVLAAEERQS